MHQFVKIIKDNPFWKNVITLSSGTAIAQLIPLICSPILSRLFSPDQFGVYGTFISIVMVLSVLACGRYEMAILLPNDLKSRINLLTLSLLLAFFFSVAITLLIHLKSSYLIKFLGYPEEKYLYLIPISVFLISINLSLNYWFNKERKYKILSLSRVIKSFGTYAFSLIFGFFNLKTMGLILGYILGQIVIGIYLLYYFIKDLGCNYNLISRIDISETAFRYSKFPKFNILSGLFEKGSGYAPIILLTVLFSKNEAGNFTLAFTVISMPVTLIATAIGDVFREKASSKYQINGECFLLFKSTFRKLLIIGVPLFLIIFFGIKFSFTYIFGERWILASSYSQTMCLMFCFQFICSPLSSMYIIAEKQNLDLLNNFILFLLCICSFYIGSFYLDSSSAIKVCGEYLSASE